MDDPESPHDGWVCIKGPRPDPVAVDGTWKLSDKVGWFELSHLTSTSPDESQYLLTLGNDGNVKSCIRVK
jgi:hypothetical protein